MELRSLISVLWKRLWLLILIPAAATAGMVYYSSTHYLPEYEAKTTLYVTNNSTSRQGSTMQTSIEITKLLVNDYRELIQSKLITSAIIQQLGLKGITPEELSQRVSIAAKEGTRVVVISAVSTNPDIARDIADKTAGLFAEKAVELMQVDDVSIIDKASTPTAPLEGTSNRNILLAFVMGAAAAVAIVLFIEYMDDTVRTRDDLEKHLEIPVLGVIPVHRIR